MHKIQDTAFFNSGSLLRMEKYHRHFGSDLFGQGNYHKIHMIDFVRNRIMLNVLDTASGLFEFDAFNLKRDEHVLAGFRVKCFKKCFFRNLQREWFHSMAVNNARDHFIAANPASLPGTLRRT